MPGHTDLNYLLKNLAPSLVVGDYVFCSLPKSYGDIFALSPIAFFMEEEGLSVIILKDVAVKHGLAFDAVFRCITLKVKSSLQAVGLTAAVSAKLTEKYISANVVAAYHHDHLLVPAQHVEQALIALQELSSG